LNYPHEIVAPLHQLLTGLSQQGELHLGEVQADLRQTSYLLGAAIDKLGKSFIGIHEAMVAQQALLVSQACAPAAVPLAPALQDRLTQLQAQSRMHADAAITALQFEDMTAQLIGRIAGHVESLQTVLGTLGAGAGALSAHRGSGAGLNVAAGDDATGTPERPDTPDAAVAAVLASLNRVLDAHGANAPSVAKKTVAQTHMDSGDIELF
jgi:hypothetical protein